jgi:hypothetical protein
VGNTKGRFIAMSAYMRKSERSQINNPMMHIKLLEKQEQVNPKSSRQKEIIKNLWQKSMKWRPKEK